MPSANLDSGQLIDISPLISERIAVFPGDMNYRRTSSLDFAKGDHLRLSGLETTLHLGAHADAPNHYASIGEGIASRDLRRYFGSCLVLVANGHKPHERIGRQHLNADLLKQRPFPAPRVLIRTDSFPNPDVWSEDFNAIDPSLIHELADCGVKLIGIDTPSIDPAPAKELLAHEAVFERDLAILEGLVLDRVSERLYTLIALPLRLEGADASPVRAVLIETASRSES